MSPLSNVQFSRFTETEVAKILTFGSDGLLEVMVPMTDDERRDIETHLKEKFRLSLSIQVKARHVLIRRNPPLDPVRRDRHSRDRWRPYACDPAEVAGRVIEFLSAQSVYRQSAGARAATIQPGTILVGRAACRPARYLAD